MQYMSLQTQTFIAFLRVSDDFEPLLYLCYYGPRWSDTYVIYHDSAIVVTLASDMR